MHACLETSFAELKLLTQRVCTLLTLRDAARMVLAGDEWDCVTENV